MLKFTNGEVASNSDNFNCSTNM